jgi:excisionase family DNA binding protein
MQSREVDWSQLPLFLSVRTAAQVLGVSPERLLRALKADQIPSLVVGSRRLVARATLERAAAAAKEDGA